MRRVLERYIVGSKSLSLYPADRAVYVEDDNGYGLNGILDNQIVIYDADTGVSVGPGVTCATNPRLVIAQGIDTDGDGVADVLRKSAYDFIDSHGISAATAEGPECGQVKILDVGIGCVGRGESISLTIEARTGHTENFYNYNDYERFTETVEFGFDPCENCDQPLECKEVVCALANKFNARDVKNSIKKQGSLIKRVKEHQLKDKPFHVYVLHENDYEFCFSTEVGTCAKCNTIDAITGVIVDGVTYEFNLTTNPDDTTTTTVGQVKRVIKLINNILSKDNIGYALDASTFAGSGKPCCDGVKLLINSCKTVELLGAGKSPIAPCATGLPTHDVVTQGECGACSSSTTETFCAFLRIVPKPIDLDKFCDRPDSYQKTLYTDIRVTTSYNNNNIGKFKVFELQPYKMPKNLAYQALHKVALQDTSANAPFSWGYDEFVGKYKNFLKGSRTSEMLHGLIGGCDSFDGLCVYNLEHSAFGKHQRVHGDQYSPRVRTTILIPNSNTAAKTEFEAIINPWLTSIGGFQTITCSVDQDQIERTYIFPDGKIDVMDYPNANGKIL
jgi:hypothetical protein